MQIGHCCWRLFLAVVGSLSAALVGWSQDGLTLPTRSGPGSMQQHVEALGTHAGIWGTLSDGLEAWVYPFKAFDNLEFGWVKEGGRFVSLNRQIRKHISSPHQATLEFASEDATVSITLFCPRGIPGGVIEINASLPPGVELAARFRPVVTPMHRDISHDLFMRWDIESRTWAFKAGRSEALLLMRPTVGSQMVVDGDGVLMLRFPELGNPHHSLVFYLAQTEFPEALRQLDLLVDNIAARRLQAQEYYSELIRRLPKVISPDAEVNEALLWSGISLDQLRVNNPDLGWGLVSGYSSSRGTTRPKYAWFFEEPTLTSWAYHRLGLSRHVREAFEFLRPHHRADGKTVHEVTQSLVHWPKFLEEFRYAYMHSDGPVYYLAGYGHYLRSTGDLDFIRRHWQVIQNAFRWCRRQIDPNDGLITVDRGDWGSAESSTAIWKDTQLEAMWVRALKEVAYMARQLGEDGIAVEAEQMKARAQASIEARFWNDDRGFYIWGMDRSGRRVDSLVPHHSVGFWLSDLKSDRIVRALRVLASSEFMTDWGVRSLALSDPRFDESSYQSGSVWPVWHAGVAICDYRHGQSVRGFMNWHSMIEARWGSGLGPMPEVFRGDRFELLPDAVPHQMFSEVSVVSGFYEGLLGLEVDVPARRLSLAPSLPPAWDFLTVRDIPFGEERFDLQLLKQNDSLQIALEWRGAAPIHVDFNPELPGHSIIEKVTDSVGTPYFTVMRTAAAKRVRFSRTLPAGTYRAEIKQDLGLEFSVESPPLVMGQTSQRLRILDYCIRGNWWEATVEGRPDRRYRIGFNGPELELGRQVLGGTLMLEEGGQFALETRAPEDGSVNLAGYVRWPIRLELSARKDRKQLLEPSLTQGGDPNQSILAWRRKTTNIRRAMQRVMGRLPGEERRVPLDVKVIEEVDCGSYVRRLIEYQSEPNSRVPAYLLIPKACLDGSATAPGVLSLHPTDDQVGHKVVVGLGGRSGRNYAEELAKRGFVTIAPSYPLLADYQPDLKRLGYRSGTMKAVWDNMRAIDLLESLDYVEPRAIAAIGHSLGGHNAIYTAVFDARVRAIATSCAFDSFLDYKGGDIRGWTSDRYMPELLDYELESIPFDFHELVGALAPRGVFVSAPKGDSNFRWESVAQIVSAARPVYSLFGAESVLQVRHPECGHDFPPDLRDEAYEFLSAQVREN